MAGLLCWLMNVVPVYISAATETVCLEQRESMKPTDASSRCCSRLALDIIRHHGLQSD